MRLPCYVCCLVLVVTMVTPTSTPAQDRKHLAQGQEHHDLLHPVPFLESSDLFLTLRPLRGLVRDESIAFDAHIYPHFILFGADHCYPHEPQTGSTTNQWSRSRRPCVSISPAVRLRMQDTNSNPVHSPSFLPRVNAQWLNYKEDITWGIGMHFGHHSNGQVGDLFAYTDQNKADACRHDREKPSCPENWESGRLLPALRNWERDQEEAEIKPDTENGNFSANYLRISFDFARYNSSMDVKNWNAGYRVAASVEHYPEPWLYHRLKDGVYPDIWLRAGVGVASANVPLCQRAEYFGGIVSYQRRSWEMALDARWYCMFTPERGLGFLLKYTYGRDEYNTSFFEPKAHGIQIGLTINRRRTFGAAY